MKGRNQQQQNKSLFKLEWRQKWLIYLEHFENIWFYRRKTITHIFPLHPYSNILANWRAVEKIKEISKSALIWNMSWYLYINVQRLKKCQYFYVISFYWSALATAPTSASAEAKEASNFTICCFFLSPTIELQLPGNLESSKSAWKLLLTQLEEISRKKMTYPPPKKK